MIVNLRGNPKTYAGIPLTTGRNKVTPEAYVSLCTNDSFRAAVTSGLIRLPEGTVLADNTPVPSQRPMRPAIPVQGAPEREAAAPEVPE